MVMQKFHLPGGCAIGTRPVDLHIDGLKKWALSLLFKDGYIKAKVKGRLKGCEIKFKKNFCWSDGKYYYGSNFG